MDVTSPHMHDKSVGAAGFAPTGRLANPHVQSMLASSKLRRKYLRARFPAMARASQRLILNCGDGVRLFGFHSQQPQGAGSKGLVVLIHGWEGCRESVYLFSMATSLYEAGFDVLRLDQRDHGDSYHLNQDPFHSARLSDPLGALHDIALRLPGGENPYLVGFSLGGNFALRLARAAPDHGLSLAHVLAVSPSINPLATIEAIDNAPWLYPWYFKRKWHRSLAAKERAFPGVFDFSDFRSASSFVHATELFAAKLTPFETMPEYLAAYEVTTETMAGLAIPTTVLTAADDPVVPSEDFDHFELPRAYGDVIVAESGGHCGFVEGWQMRCFSDRLALSLF